MKFTVRQNKSRFFCFFFFLFFFFKYIEMLLDRLASVDMDTLVADIKQYF